MTTFALRKQIKADANHTIHITLPPEMGDDVEVIVWPTRGAEPEKPDESLWVASAVDDSGFAKNILNSTEEDCWNDL